jgi:hypothetical protein
MVHTALPDLPRRALWLQEGNATWVEPIARAQAGQLAISEVWREAVEGMPHGVANPDAGGMDGTRVWGRLYWGGATFWLLAEIALYEQSRGRYTLRDALRAINRQSGGNGARWSPEQMMDAGDTATGGAPTLRRLYERHAMTAVATDLDALFARLGISLDRLGSAHLDPHAELAGLTRRLTQA